MGHSFTWWHYIGIPFFQHNIHVCGSITVFLILLVLAVLAHWKLKKNPAIVPSKKVTTVNIFEIIVENLKGLVLNTMGKEGERFFPLIASLFLFILTSNLLGLIPGFLPPTDNLNTTLGLGLFVFLFYNFMGFKTHGIKYVKQFFGPLWWLAPLMIIIELISHMVRPVSLALRLRGNIFGDHLVLSVISQILPIPAKVGIPVIFYGLGLFISLIQALVFCLLTMVYISLATSHDH